MQGCENSKIYYLKKNYFWESYSILMRKITVEYPTFNKIKRNVEKSLNIIILNEALHYQYIEDIWEIEKNLSI